MKKSRDCIFNLDKHDVRKPELGETNFWSDLGRCILRDFVIKPRSILLGDFGPELFDVLSTLDFALTAYSF